MKSSQSGPSRQDLCTGYRRSRSMGGRLQTGLIAGVLGFFALSCTGDRPTGVVPDARVVPTGPLFALGDDPLISAGQCMDDDVADFGGGPVNCTATDTKIAEVILTQINGANYDPAVDPPFVCNAATVDIGVRALLETNAEKDRADVGIWLATDGGNARTGQCNQYIIPPGQNITNAVNPDADQCAGIASKTTVSLNMGTLTLPCVDNNNDGFLDLNGCIAWDVPGQDGVCADNRDGVLPGGEATDFRAATIPGTPAKCNCSTFQIPIIIPKFATIEVKKECVPATDGGTFDLLIDAANTNGNNKACGGTTGTIQVSAGTNASPGATHTVAETDFSLGATSYTSTLRCTKNGAAYLAEAAYTSPTNVDVEVQPEDAVVCTFKNTRKSTIEIVKVTAPSPDAANTDFTFASPTLDPTSFTLKNGGMRTFSNVTPNTAGGYAVTEDDPTPGYDLTDITCTNPDGQNASTTTLASRLATVRVNAGETVRCTFTNTKRGIVKITKVTDPAPNTTDSFGFTDTGLSPTSFSLKNGETRTFSNVVPNISATGYPVIEDNPTPGFDLTNISCTNPDGQNASTTDLTTRKATVKVNPGETVECTFTNRQRATVEANKTQSGQAPAAGAFKFEIRSGASLSSVGTTVATGTNNAAGLVTFTCSGGDPTKCTNDGGSIAHLVPGNYQFCEVEMLPGWANNLAGFTPNGNDPLADNSAECVNITLGAGGSGVPTGVPTIIDNTPPPGGDRRTIGFWKTHSCEAPGRQADVLSLWLPVNVGIGYADASDFILTEGDCHAAVSLLDKRNITNGKKSASDAAYGLAAQLIAALLNVNAGAGTCGGAITPVIAQAQILLDRIDFDGTKSYLTKSNTADYSLANSLATTLDNYNNNICPAP
jgi:hypothetical protein